MLKKIMLPALLVLGINANADDAKGLIGVEVGYVGMDVYKPNSTTNQTEKIDAASFGLKLGGESRFYRAFIDARVWNARDVDRCYTVGGALQYLINPAEFFNIFMGVNAGVAHSVKDSNAVDPYYGLDAGLNFHITESFDIELGARYSEVMGSKDAYIMDDFYQGYISAIFKFTGEY
jgi:hypothetical protein